MYLLSWSTEYYIAWRPRPLSAWLLLWGPPTLWPIIVLRRGWTGMTRFICPVCLLRSGGGGIQLSFQASEPRIQVSFLSSPLALVCCLGNLIFRTPSTDQHQKKEWQRQSQSAWWSDPWQRSPVSSQQQWRFADFAVSCHPLQPPSLPPLLLLPNRTSPLAKVSTRSSEAEGAHMISLSWLAMFFFAELEEEGEVTTAANKKRAVK